MNKQKVKLAGLLFLLGLIGVASILTMDIPLPAEAEALLKETFTPGQIKLLILINPTLFMLIAVVVGTLLYESVQLSVPLLEKALGKNSDIQPASVLKAGLVGGLLAGVLISLVGLIANPFLPAEFVELGNNLKPSLAARFLYGGFTEELMLRFGFMTLVVWICSKVAKGLNPTVFWLGIIISSIVFALGHFPIAYQAVENPSFTLLTYILVGNTVGGIIFGWLYWKKGLESAFVAHMLAHVVMLLAESLVA